ncbi:MAG: glycosyl hydrolase 2 galactose-binding domain-containing protein [Bacteroidia bacterium]
MNKANQLIILLLFISRFAIAGELDLGACKWSFKELNSKGKWYSAQVPGTVHTDLMKHKLIPDPFLQENEKQVQWVSKKDWVYSCDFQLPPSLLKDKHIQLNCEGLDTYADVYVNHKKVISANNMFRAWQAEVKSLLLAGKNNLRIVFKSNLATAEKLYQALPVPLPNDERVMLRKAQYQFGWDWGPRLITCGIYKKISLKSWSDVQISSVQFVQKELHNQQAKIELNLELNLDQAGKYYVSVINSLTSEKLKDSIVYCASKSASIRLNFEMNQVKYWWTNGLGEPYLYNLQTSVIAENGSYDKQVQRIGFKNLELVQEPDSMGRSFYFKLNGIPLYIKGANYIPQDNFVSRTSLSQTKHLLEQAQKSHMNMLRVWGGGLYESDEFYETCDELGLLVWQDFMFACAMYPGDESFVNNVKQEVIHQVKRIRHHASLALWCGNNEISEGWFNWGWQKQYGYSAADSLRIWNDYQKLFLKEIPQLLSVYDAQHAYWPSSPQFGWGRKESLLQGDAHYWGVWWGEEPFEMYRKKVGRFNSEYGFQGFPSKEIFLSFTDTNHLHIDSAVIAFHNKHPRGLQTIKKYMERAYNLPRSFDDYLYLSQCLQADGMKIAIEAHRSRMPYNMGTLYWQLNDCWPVISWSGIDYQHKWKAAQYQIKRSFEPLIMTWIDEGDSISLNLISDLQKTEMAQLKIVLEDFKGNNFLQLNENCMLPINQAVVVKKLAKAQLKSFANISELILNASLQTASQKSISSNFYFVEVKDMKLNKQDLSYQLIPQKSGFELVVKANEFHKNIWIESMGELSDNFFDLRAGESKHIFIQGIKNKSSLPIDVKSINSLMK